MAGGRGSRISSVVSDVPKPMIRVCGKPILEYQIENLRRFGIVDITLVIGHLGDVVSEYFADGAAFGVRISYFAEDFPLGTAGALLKMDDLKEDFILLCGDIIFDVDFDRFISFHKERKGLATLLTHPNSHPYDSALIETEILPPSRPGAMPSDSFRVLAWLNKEDERSFHKNRVNAGIEIISPELLQIYKDGLLGKEVREKVDLDRDILKPAITSGKIFAYDTPEYVKDMGTPDRLKDVERDLKSGLVRARNLKNKQKAVFLDRDGTLNEMSGFVAAPQQLKMLPEAAEAVKLINKSGYLAIVVTNQPVIARGDCDFCDLQLINNKMETELGRGGAFLDAIYVCPHHTDRGFPGERADYKFACKCRKPEPGLLLEAARDFNIDLSESYMIGDSDSDVEAGRRAFLRGSIKIRRNSGEDLVSVLKDIL